MKKILLFAAVTSVLFVSCEKDLKKLTQFKQELNYTETIAVSGVDNATMVPVGQPLPNGGQTISFPKQATATNSAQYMKDYNTTSDKIDSLIMSKLALAMSKPANGNFDFLESIKIYMSATGMSEVMCASKLSIPKGSSKIDLDIVKTNFKEYFLKDSIFFRTEAKVVLVPDTAAQMDLNTTFALYANPLN